MQRHFGRRNADCRFPARDENDLESHLIHPLTKGLCCEGRSLRQPFYVVGQSIKILNLFVIKLCFA